MVSQKTITPNWLMKLLGSKAAVFSVVDDGFFIRFESGESYTILPECLVNEAVLEKGLILSRLVLKTNCGCKTIGGLREKDAVAVHNWLKVSWVKILAPLVNKDARRIQQELNDGYLRTSRWKHVAQQAKDSLVRFDGLTYEDAASDIDVSGFDFIHRVANWRIKDVDVFREQYVAKQSEVYKAYFDSVESNPLTDRQRSACIVDEVNNLVLAGAGTGKTSVMVGRAGYLLKSNQAKSGQILMLAFANKAAKEMQERLDNRLEDNRVRSSTFHKLGKDIIAAVEGCQPSISPLADDDKLLAKHVDQWFEQKLSSEDYKLKALNYFQNHLYQVENSFDFETEGEYFEYLQDNEIRTLKGEQVKSLGECFVANHLFKLGIDYQYEAAYEHETKSLDFRQYQPDFYLPEYDIYIEYYGLDRDGNTAPHVDRENYHKGMEWKRQLHATHNTKLMELYHYQRTEGKLFSEIDAQLKTREVEVKPLPADAILATLREFGAVSELSKLLANLLRHYRANCYVDSDGFIPIGRAKNPAQFSAALDLLLPIVDEYTKLLAENGHIDFEDMIGKAIKYVQVKKFVSPWTYILVDEFQDISEPRARLVKLLRDSVAGCSLFCVGDDWQAIYRFTGSDLSFTTGFKRYFGYTKTTELDLTFRFNDSVSGVASQFVLQNPAQLKKTLRTFDRVKQPAVSLLRADNARRDHDGDSRLVSVLEKINIIARPGSSVYLLARFGLDLPKTQQLKTLRARYPELCIETQTIHASKGKEADYVVVLGLERGKHGFPSQKRTHQLLEALLPAQEDYPHAEERRLLYVAITRARHRVYLITDMAVASEFIVEMLKDDYPLELNEFTTSLSQELFQLIHCVKCVTGSMVARTSKYGRFFGCNNFPLCNHSEKGCSVCDGPMKREGRFKVCLDPSCGSWVPVCPDCGAELVQRVGRHGTFWGCKNYRGSGAVSCSHSESDIVYVPLVGAI